jgi:aspartate 1-decarboxylase
MRLRVPYMLISILKSKIHRAQVTAASLEYQGSLTVSQDLMEQVDLIPYERILCSNLANGHRFETYVIPGRREAGEIILNGATAHLGKVGDRLVIMSFIQMDPGEARIWKPRVIVLGERNVVRNQVAQ